MFFVEIGCKKLSTRQSGLEGIFSNVEASSDSQANSPIRDEDISLGDFRNQGPKRGMERKFMNFHDAGQPERGLRNSWTPGVGFHKSWLINLPPLTFKKA